MADEKGRKGGTIFMGDRETSAEELHAMQEPLRREQIRREQADEYMERVRNKAADRAREILGAAYAEKQNVLDEARKETLALKKQAIEERERLKAEGETARREAQAELDKATALREEAERVRAGARDEGYQAGLDEASADIAELRSNMGQSLALILNALGRQRKEIITRWAEDLAEVVRCSARAGTGLILNQEHEAVLRSLVFKALDLLERQETVALRVNPEDEDAVGKMFQAAREKYPNLRQWIVSGDAGVEKGGLIAESGSGSVDLRRANFEEVVERALKHLYLPEDEETNQNEIRDLVEREVAWIAGMTPEPEPIEPPRAEEPEEIAPQEDETTPEEEIAADAEAPDEGEESADILEELEAEDHEASLAAAREDATEEDATEYAEEELASPRPAQPTYEELDEEFFPLDDLDAPETPEQSEPAAPAKPAKPAAPKPAKPVEPPDPEILAGGGFL